MRDNEARTNSTRLGLVTKGVDDLGAGSNEGQTGRFDFRCENSVLGKEAVSGEPPDSEQYRMMRLGLSDSPRVDHVHTVLESDPDDVVLGEVRGDGSDTLADLVRLVGLKHSVSHGG